MAQKGISYLHKVGSHQHWVGSWDSYKAWKLNQKQTWLVEHVISTFIESRSSFHASLIDVDLCFEQLDYWDCKPKDENYYGLVRLVRRQRAKRKMVVTIGRIAFMRFHGWLIILVNTLKPRLDRPVFLGVARTTSTSNGHLRGISLINHVTGSMQSDIF